MMTEMLFCSVNGDIHVESRVTSSRSGANFPCSTRRAADCLCLNHIEQQRIGRGERKSNNKSNALSVGAVTLTRTNVALSMICLLSFMYSYFAIQSTLR